MRVSLPFLCIWQPCWPIYILLILFPFEHLFEKSELLSIHHFKSKGEEKTQMVIVFLLIRSVGSGNRRKLARCVDSVRVRVPPSSRSPDVDRYTAHKKKRKRMPPCRHVSFLSVRNGFFQRFILSNIDRRVPQQLVFFPTIPLF